MMILKRFMTLFILLPFCCWAQVESYINKVWVGEHLEYLKFSHDTLIIDDKYGVDMYCYKIYADTLGVFSWDFKDDITKQGIYSAKFLIGKFGKDSLQLTPLNYLYTRYYFTDTNTIKFIDKNLLIDSILNFQKLVFTSSGCYGQCPEYKILIDSSGSVKVSVGQSEFIKPGLYICKLSKNEFRKFNSILKRSKLDLFPEILFGGIDMPIYSFEFCYNNLVRKSRGSFVPYFNYELKYYLLDLPKTLKLKQISKANEFK